MLLISLCFDRNGQNILYRHAVRYGNITCSTSSQISVNFGKFRQFWLNCTFRPISNLGNLKKKIKKKIKNIYIPINLRSLPCRWLPFFFFSSQFLHLLLLPLFSVSSSPFCSFSFTLLIF